MAATKIVIQNKAVESADAADAARKLKNILGDLRDGYQNWDTLTAAGRNAVLKLVVRAVIVLIRRELAE